MLEIFILILLILFLIVMISSHTWNSTNDMEIEPFTTSLSACPSGFQSFYNSNSDMICCEGTIFANKCLGERKCILNGKGTKDTPNCVVFMEEEYGKKANELCPSTMTTYFENKTTKQKGCTQGPLNKNMTGPLRSDQPTCIIYSDFNKNMTSSDSCYQMKQADAVECFGKNCSKRIIQLNKNGPPLVALEFQDDLGLIHVAYTRESLTNYLNVVQPNWKEQGIDLNVNINVADVAKAFYIDKTMDSSSIQL
jgi:hypothetical protein